MNLKARPSDIVRQTLSPSGLTVYVPRSTVGDVRRTRSGCNVTVGGKVVAVTESFQELADGSAPPNRLGVGAKIGSFDAGKLGG